MTHYDYEPIPLDVPERMADDVPTRSAIAHRDFVSQRRTVRHFSDAQIDQACYQLGLATLTHAADPMKFPNEILRRPQNERFFLLLVVGHSSSNALVPRAATEKKFLSEIASFA